jgi:hypothetical protein
LDLRDTASGPVSEAVGAARCSFERQYPALSRQTVPRQTFDADPAKVIWHYPVEI